jgi:Zn-dependent M28 family amino/carboxypeptidase
MKKFASVAALLAASLLSAQALIAQNKQSGGLDDAMKAIDSERMRATVKYLSDDALEGRGTGQKGGDLAADWIAAQFKSYGLQPAGDNGTYFQNINFFGVTTDATKTHFSFKPKSGPEMALRFADDFVATDQTHSEKSVIDAPIVFVGYGIDAPEYTWNDYKGADLKGKVLLMLVNEPPSDDPKFFKGAALTYYGRWTYKFEEAARRGAVGVILIHKKEMASYGWEVVRNSWGGETSLLANDRDPKLKSAGWIQLEVARKLATASGMDLDKMMHDATSRSFQPVELSVRLNATIVSHVREFSSRNVIGKVAGSSTEPSPKAVIYTAHYDHLGIHPNEPGDNIYNGAADNGTGCGIVLELARVVAAAKHPPKDTMIFATVTAEEQGLLGSKYLGQHPPIPARDISLNLNFDQLVPLGEPQELVATGAERTTAFPLVQKLAREFGMSIAPDDNPGAGHYYRSDHFSMARVGVPAFSVNQGVLFKGHDRAWGQAKTDDFEAHHYHQPSDEYHPDMDFTGNAKMARFGLALGWQVANLPGVVQWQPGDEFEKARKIARLGLSDSRLMTRSNDQGFNPWQPVDEFEKA